MAVTDSGLTVLVFSFICGKFFEIHVADSGLEPIIIQHEEQVTALAAHKNSVFY
jgi:hypothetical protein